MRFIIRYLVLIVIIVYGAEYIRTYWPDAWPTWKLPMPPPPWELLDDGPERIRKEANRFLSEAEKLRKRGEDFLSREGQTLHRVADEPRRQIEDSLRKVESTLPKPSSPLPRQIKIP
jgi:hypothetical protein